MSVEQIAAALNHEHPGLSGTRKLVLLGIANHAAPDGTDAWPSIDTLARYAGVNRRNARKALGWLAEEGLIVVEEGRGGTHDTPDRYRPNRYRITLNPGGSLPTSLDRPGGSETTSRGVAGDRSGGSQETPEPSIEPSRTVPLASVDAVAGPVEAVDVVEYDPSGAALAATFVDPARELCETFAALLRARGVRVPATRPGSQAWVDPMEKLLRLDGRDPDEVERTLRWLDNGADRISHFWRSNVLSPDALRRQWDRMAEQYRRESGPRPSRGAAIASRAGSGRPLSEILLTEDLDEIGAGSDPDTLALEAPR